MRSAPDTGLHRAASRRPRPVMVDDEAGLASTSEDVARSDAPGRAGVRRCWPGRGPLTIGSWKPVAPPALGTPAPRRPAMRASWTTSFPCSRLNPAARQGRPGSYGRSAPSPASHFASACTFALRGLRSAGFRPRLLKKRPLTPRPAHSVRWELYSPSREAAGPPRRAACSSPPPPESAVDTARTCASSAWPRIRVRLGRAWLAPAPGPRRELLDPQGRSVHLLQCQILSLRSGYSPPTALRIPRGAGVSVGWQRRSSSISLQIV